MTNIYKYKQEKYQTKLERVLENKPTLTTGGSHFFKKNTLEVTISIPATTTHKIFSFTKNDKINTIGDLKRIINSDPSLSDYHHNTILYQFNSGNFSSAFGKKIKIKQTQLNPSWYVKRSPGSSDSQIVYTSTIRKDYIIFHYKNHLTPYSHPWKSNVLIDTDSLNRISGSMTYIPDYECTVTKYDAEKNKCRCKKDSLVHILPKTFYECNQLDYSYVNDQWYIDELSDTTLLAKLKTPDNTCQLVIYNDTNINKEIQIVNPGGSGFTFQYRQNGYVDQLTIKDIKDYIIEQDNSYQLNQIYLYREGEEEVLDDNTPIANIDTLFLLRKLPETDV